VTAWGGDATSIATDAAHLPKVDLEHWKGAAPAAVTTNGYIQTAMLRWLTDDAGGTPSVLISGRVDSNTQAMATGVIASGIIATGALNDIANNLLDLANAVEGAPTSITVRQAYRAMLAAAAGVISGAATTSVTLFTADGGTTRIQATVDANGNRSAIILSL